MKIKVGKIYNCGDDKVKIVSELKEERYGGFMWRSGPDISSLYIGIKLDEDGDACCDGEIDIFYEDGRKCSENNGDLQYDLSEIKENTTEKSCDCNKKRLQQLLGKKINRFTIENDGSRFSIDYDYDRSISFSALQGFSLITLGEIERNSKVLKIKQDSKIEQAKSCFSKFYSTDSYLFITEKYDFIIFHKYLHQG